MVFQISFLEMKRIEKKKAQKTLNENTGNQQEKASMNCEIYREENFLQRNTCSPL